MASVVCAVGRPVASVVPAVGLPQLAPRASAVLDPVQIDGAAALARGALHRACDTRRNTPVRRADSVTKRPQHRSLTPNGDILCTRFVHKLLCTFGR